MKAAFYRDFSGPLTIETLPDPVPPAAGVVIGVRATGLCRSDWHGWMGHDPDIRLPHVPGHEFAGVIEAVGPEVANWKPGDRVTAPFVCGCGSCPECVSGHAQVCDHQFQPGFTHWGTFAERVALDHADFNLVRLPDDLDFVTAASLGCRFVTAFRAVVDQGRVAADEWVAVHGCGGVGLSAVMIAHAFGAKVVAIDLGEAKLAFAREIGADATVDAARTGGVADAVRELTGGGAHLSLDALGSPVTCRSSLASLRKRGRHVQVGLLPATGGPVPLPMDRVIANELEILGSHGMPAHRYPALLGMIADGRLEPGKLIGRRIPLEDVVTGLPAMDRFPGPGVTVLDRF